MANDDLEALFAQRAEIDRNLAEKQRELAVMFTDIVGSTQYFEQKGDIAGMQLLRRHNALLFPRVEHAGGRIIKTIGDAIMAVFDDAESAVRCAQAMQQTLETEERPPGVEQIRIRIGLHFGRAFTTEKDVFGDTVNTAARVAHEAQAQEIVVSQGVAELLASRGGFSLKPRGSVALKGKAEPLPLVAVSWRDASPENRPGTTGQAPADLFVLELQRGPSGLKVAAIEGSADQDTVKPYGETSVSLEELEGAASQFSAFLGGGAASSYLAEIQERGRALFERALSERARARLRETHLEFLRLQLDDELVGVPWELLHDGTGFLSLRFAMGRAVAARSEARHPTVEAGPRSGHALVVSNPSGGLGAASREGDAIAGLLREGFDGEVRHLKGPVTRAAFLNALQGCALLHFAGHSEPGAGLLLADGSCSAADLAEAVGGSAPGIVFANACSASDGTGFTRGARGVADLASTLLLRGTVHLVGPTTQVADADALEFALRFYESALGGSSLGEAVRGARRALAGHADRPLAFAAYVLYGDPRRGLPGRVKLKAAVATRSPREKAFTPAPPPRAPPSAAVVPSRTRGPLYAAIAAGVVMVALGLVGARAYTTRTVEVLAATPPPKAAPTAGPIRISVLPFKNVTGAAELDYLKNGLSEAIVTDFEGTQGARLIEHGSLDQEIEYLEFSQTKYVDPETRARLGKITGAEVVVMGSFQRSGEVLRANTRFVVVETGEVLESIKLERPAADAFAFQDAVGEAVAQAYAKVRAALRPEGK